MNRDALEKEIPISEVELDELLISIGGTLFAGADMEEIDSLLLHKLEDLIKAELIVRENKGIPEGEVIH